MLLDRRGHGRSDWASTGYDLDTLAGDVATLLERLDLRDVTLVGFSSGGAEVARYLALYGEERIAGVAFVSAVIPFLRRTDDNPNGATLEMSEASVAQFRSDRPKWFTDRSQGYFATHLGNDVSPALVDHTMRRCLDVSPTATVALWRAVSAADHRAGLREIGVPALVVHGGADQSAPVALTGRRTAELVPDAVYEEYPTAGHGLYVTHRDPLNAALLDLLARSEVRVNEPA